jgi:hypothetical protein
MPGVTGFEHGARQRAGFKFHTSEEWNSPTGVGMELAAGDGFEIRLDGGLKANVELDQNNASPAGPALRIVPTKKTEHYSGVIPFNLQFNGSQRFYAAFFGTEAVSVLTAGQSFSHLFTWNTDLVGIYATFMHGGKTSGYNYPFVKATELMLDWPHSGIPLGGLGVLGKRLIFNDTGTTTLAELHANVTQPTQPSLKYPQMQQAIATVRCKPASGSALASGDELYPGPVKVKLARKMATHFTARNAPYMDEPKGGDFEGGEIEFTFPSWQTESTTNTYATIWEYLRSGTELMWSISIDSGVDIGSSSDNWKLLLEVPSFVGTADGLPDPIKGADLPDIKIKGQVYTAAANPTGMTTRYPRLTVQDSEDGSHLANGV